VDSEEGGRRRNLSYIGGICWAHIVGPSFQVPPEPSGNGHSLGKVKIGHTEKGKR